MSQTSQQEHVRNITTIPTQTIALTASSSETAEDDRTIDAAIEDAFAIDPYLGSRAVEDALAAYNEAYRLALKNKENEVGARKAAAKAYRQKIPALHNSYCIADFIACVGHGLVLGIFESAEASRLLYAAQVAHTAIPNSVRRWPLPNSRADIKAMAEPYVGPEDNWAGIQDQSTREYYQKHAPKGSRNAGAF